MKKYLISLSILLVSLFSTINAFSTTVIVPFSGSNAPSGKFYTAIWQDIELITGFSAAISSDELKSSEVDLQLGFKANISIFNEIEVISTLDRYAINNGSKQFRLKKIGVGKKWLYPFNEYIQIGIDMTIAEMHVDGSKQWNILPSLTPVLSFNIVF